MEYNKEEAGRAMDIAERKLSENDYVGAKKFVNKAQNLYPNLEGLKQVLMMIDVYISASKNVKGEADWYGILSVDPLADDEAVKKQYKKLALLLHPDKNKFHGAEEAFKSVLEAWCLLSDKAKRIAYDQKRKSKEVKQEKKTWKQQKPPEPQEPVSSNKPKPEPNSFLKKEKVCTFWTMCNRCKTYCEYVRANYLNKTLSCPNCGQDFVAAEIIPGIINGRPFIRMSPSFQSTRKTPIDSAKAAHKRMKRWFEPKPEPDFSSKKEKVRMFWTVCNRCKTYYKFVRTNYLNKTLSCQNCGQHFVAAEIIPEIINGSPVIR